MFLFLVMLSGSFAESIDDLMKWRKDSNVCHPISVSEIFTHRRERRARDGRVGEECESETYSPKRGMWVRDSLSKKRNVNSSTRPRVFVQSFYQFVSYVQGPWGLLKAAMWSSTTRQQRITLVSKRTHSDQHWRPDMIRILTQSLIVQHWCEQRGE